MKATDTTITIREFEAGDEIAFRKLNEEWISHYFTMEAGDEELIAHPQQSILAKGGRIFLAVRDGRPVGCCALLMESADQYELAKMAVTESARGNGIGRRLLEHAIAQARALRARRLHLGTNHELTTAIRLYESAGFQRIPPERAAPTPYVRCDVQMELFFD